MYTIARLGHEHVADYHRLRLAALHDTPTAFTGSIPTEQATPEAQLRERIAGASLSTIWGAWDAQGALVGTTGVLHLAQEKIQHKATVYAVYVAPSARGAGLARALMQAAIEYARAQPALRQLQLAVTVGNDRAHQLYQSLGFVEYGREPETIWANGGYHDQILMSLPLR